MKTPLARRRVVAGAALIGFPALWRAATAQTTLRPTPAQTEGPFYPVELPADRDADLLLQGTTRYSQGTPAWLEGSVVVDTTGRPLAGGVVEIWQCDANGHYHHPGDGGRADPAFQGFGRVEAGADGGYRFRTIQPVPYTGRTPHIHLKVKLPGRELLTTQVYIEGDPNNPRDGLWRRLSEQDRAAVTVRFAREADGVRARFPIVVRA